jgi:acyl-CoA-dependent ceramide synthase
MSKQPTWWYDTKHFWIGYPHWRMLPELKVYYLLQFSYWLQQLLVLVLRIEKPRSDFFELTCHVCMTSLRMVMLADPALQHIVTLWLVGWSYFLNLTCESLHGVSVQLY